MYEEKNNFSVRTIILQILAIVLFLLIMIWLFPTKDYADGTYDALWTKWIDASGEGEEAAAAEDTETAV